MSAHTCIKRLSLFPAKRFRRHGNDGHSGSVAALQSSYPLCVHVHAGNIHDTKGGVYTFEKALYRYPTLIGVRADQGYRGTFKNTFEIFHNLKVDISPRIKNEFEIQPVRWVVERIFGWMTWSRRLSKDYEIRYFYQENICIISNLQTLLRRF